MQVSCAEGIGNQAAPLSVLVVDDEVSLLGEIVSTLEAFDFDVLSTNNPIEALELLKQNPTIAVLVSDIKMPGLSGDKLMLTGMGLRDDNTALEGVLMSGHASERPEDTLCPGSAVIVLAKPFGLQALIDAVEQAMARARLKRSGSA